MCRLCVIFWMFCTVLSNFSFIHSFILKRKIFWLIVNVFSCILSEPKTQKAPQFYIFRSQKTDMTSVNRCHFLCWCLTMLWLYTHVEDRSVDDHALAVLVRWYFVARSVSVAQHDTCPPLGKRIGSVHDTCFSAGTCRDTRHSIWWSWTWRYGYIWFMRELKQDNLPETSSYTATGPLRHATLPDHYWLQIIRNTKHFHQWNVFDDVYNKPVIILVLIWRKSIHFQRKICVKTYIFVRSDLDLWLLDPEFAPLLTLSKVISSLN